MIESLTLSGFDFRLRLLLGFSTGSAKLIFLEVKSNEKIFLIYLAFFKLSGVGFF
jgi:hypothetical protein